MRWVDKMLSFLLPHRHRQHPIAELSDALDKNAEAHRDLAQEEAALGSRLTKQRERTDALLVKIRERVAEGKPVTPTLVAVAHALKSMEHD